jgi:hypothetical protein
MATINARNRKLRIMLISVTVLVMSYLTIGRIMSSHRASTAEQPVISSDCHGYKSKNTCNEHKPECVWCVSGAIPSACYTPDEARSLPGGVFECESSRWNYEIEGGDYQDNFETNRIEQVQY